MPDRSAPRLRVARSVNSLRLAAGSERHFIGLHLNTRDQCIDGSLVRVWGVGLAAVADVIAISRRGVLGLTTRAPDDTREPQPSRSASWDELAESVVRSLLEAQRLETSTLRTISLLDFGQWQCDVLQQWSFTPCCDTMRLAASTGLTVLDDFAGADLAQGGRGGPCEAVGAWLMLGDRGIVPGRVIRGLLDLSDTARLILLPPRQDLDLPTHLTAFEIVPVVSFLAGILDRLVGPQVSFDARELWSVQGRQLPELYEAWDACWSREATHWTPSGHDVTPLLDIVAQWPEPLVPRTADVLCTAVHWISARVADFIHHQLPKSQPIGQLILAGPARDHALLLRQLRHHLPELPSTRIDDCGFAVPAWRSVAAALMGLLHIDQVPGNSPSLTGAKASRVLGRISPGTPNNWHQILAEMATTLPDKKTLRSAV